MSALVEWISFATTQACIESSGELTRNANKQWKLGWHACHTQCTQEQDTHELRLANDYIIMQPYV